jgi:ankyrin repeat protein
MKSIIFIAVFIFITRQVTWSQSIHDLARTGTVTLMEEHLEKFPSDLNTISEQGMTPFILASYRGNNAVAKLLMDKGADIGYCSPEGTAIYGMIYKDNSELIKYVLEKGYSPNDTCQFSQFGSPLNFAMSLRRYSVISMLLKYGAKTDNLNSQGQNLKDLLLFYKDEQLTKLFEAYEK